jgi:hypothetical protein
MPNAKVGDLGSYLAHAAHIMLNVTAVMAFHLANRMRRLRWSTYIKEQKAWVIL